MKIERDKLATVLSLAEKSVKKNLTGSEAYKLLTTINELKKEIAAFDQSQEENEIGKRYSQIKMFR